MSTINSIPEYTGTSTFLNATFAPSSYFTRTAISKWSLENFFCVQDDDDIFFEGLLKIRKNKKIDVGIRAFSSALHAYYNGPLGSLRRNLCRRMATNSIKRSIVLQTHVSSALTYEETLVAQEEAIARQHATPIYNEALSSARGIGVVEKQKEINPPKESATSAKHGKRRRSIEGGVNTEQIKDGRELSEDDDPVTLAQSVEGVRMNAMFDIEDYAFTATLGEVDFGEEFTAYYEHCKSLIYDHNNLADFVALSGVLFLEDRPTSLQKAYFGTKYQQLLRLIDSRVKRPTSGEVMEAVQICRDAKDAYRKTSLSRSSVKQGRAAMEEILEMAPKSTLRSLLLYGAQLHQRCVPLSKTDQTSRFVLGTLSHIMNKVDETRVVHTANVSLTETVPVPACFELGHLPRCPDIMIRYQEIVNIGIGGVSSCPLFVKDQGDLARMLLWSKRAADNVAASFKEVDDINILFIQVIGQTCNLYVMCRAGTVCVATKIGSMDILYTLSDALSFEDHVPTWLMLEKTLNGTVSVLSKAKHRESDPARTPFPCFPELATPRSLNNKKRRQ
ncbi:hypothetical protein EMPS_07260 [Entomortierella parvispora]|uniref:Uncharacterized protein n=1 Tax=Entomortierella parvispora TaxID=205924 RepID=A0A9P3LY93_9FUNG|nr:hypothetical protein EMPS_07260 [Entomortierella parvispora]